MPQLISSLIALPDLTDPDYYAGLTPEMRDNFIRDQALARDILKNGQASAEVSANTAESACDAYAMMQHIRHYGKDSPFPAQYRGAKAAHAILGEALKHYTSPVINRVIEEVEQLGEAFFRLSGEDIAELAEEIAEEMGLDDDTLDEIRAKYARVFKNKDDGDSEEMAAIKRIVAIMNKERNNHNIFDAGKWFLSHPLRKGWMGAKAAAAGIGRFWKKALGMIEGKPLAQIFNETAKEAYEAFPQELGRLAVVVPDSENPLAYASPLAAKSLAKDRAALDKTVEGIAQRLGRTGAVSYTHGNYELAPGAYVNLIALTNDKNITGDFSGRHSREMQAVYTLDYQIGRHIVSNAYSLSQNKAESSCDAFAMLRHIQRYGKDTDLGALHNSDTASNLILFADTAHYTAETVKRVTEVAAEMGEAFFKLPLRETAELAAKIADETSLNFMKTKKLKSAFQPVAAQAAARLGNAQDIFQKFADKDPQTCAMLCRETLAVLEKHRGDADITRAAKQFLNHPPLREFITAQAIGGDKTYQRARALMNTPEPPASIKRRLLPSFIPRI